VGSVLALLALATRGATTAITQHRRLRSTEAPATTPPSPRRAYFARLGMTMLNPTTIIYFTALVLASQDATTPTHLEESAFVLAAFAASTSWQLALATSGALLGRLLTTPTARLLTALLSSALITTLAPTPTTDHPLTQNGHHAHSKRQIRASYDDETITVYQAYPNEISDPALRAGTFVEPFSMSRMTWIKPSFLWTAYRSGWATKPNQTRVLRIHITREGFEWALTHGCLSHYDRKHHPSEAAWRQTLRHSPVRIQWDPEQTSTYTPNPPPAQSK
jgi:hypothetical protein